MPDSVELLVPDIGDFKEVEIIELLVQEGDDIHAEDSLLTVESDKASMEIPASASGTLIQLRVKTGDRVSCGDVIGVITQAQVPLTAEPLSAPEPAQTEPPEQAASPVAAKPSSSSSRASVPPSPTAHVARRGDKPPHASPSVRRFARELGADIRQVPGTGRKQRILKSDVQAFVKSVLGQSTAPYAGAAPNDRDRALPPLPTVDFAAFGDVERVELSRIQRLSAEHLHCTWVNLPMVTHHDEADITDLENFRRELKDDAEYAGLRITGLAFYMKALAANLRAFPRFNSSLASDGQAIIQKHYCHIGMAVDTPSGLVVPIIRDVDQKSIADLAREMADVSARARAKKLQPSEMQGGSMTISSLGGIGGTGFTPIVNAPEVAILGISRAKMQPVWNGEGFVPRRLCPLDLSYDHRVIDGAEAARFLQRYCVLLADVRRLLLN